MKRNIFIALSLLIIVVACKPSQQITSSWVDHELMPENPYENICVIPLIHGEKRKLSVENMMVDLLNKKGYKGVKSTEIFPEEFLKGDKIPLDKMVQIMKEAGCEAVFTISLMDTETEEQYHPGTSNAQLPPYRFYYYSTYNDYVNYRYNQVNDPGYITSETTYFFETNFYDLDSKKLLWSIQSEAFDPIDMDSWFKGYSKIILKDLKKENMLRK
ncbi:MAG: hypothetical protein ACK5M7_14595 [Draconibacterium sp.]